MTTARVRRELVAGGLHAHEWSGGGPTVLALAGIGSSGIVWGRLASELPHHRVVSVDLRGRGRSSGITGPSGLLHHARDVARVAADLDLDDIVLVGHSMGAYLAPIAAREVGDRVAKLVLVDGGIPPRLPFFVTPAVTRLTWRRNAKKADRDWASAEAFARAVFGPQLGRRQDLLPELTAWMEYEMAGPPGRLRAVLSTEHAVGDAVDTFHGADVVPALDGLTVPAHLVAASFLKGDGGKPFLADAELERWQTRQPLLTTERVPGTNHVTVVFHPAVVAAVSG